MSGVRDMQNEAHDAVGRMSVKAKKKRMEYDPFIVKTVISAALFGFVILMKSVGGDKFSDIRNTVAKYIGSGADYRQAIETIGRAIADNNIAQAVENQAIKVFGMNLLVPDTEESESKIDDSEPGEADESENRYAWQNESDMDNVKDEGLEQDSLPEFGSDDFDGASEYIISEEKEASLSVLKADSPIIISSAEQLEAISALREETVDTTPATEFGKSSPSVVDDNVYKLPFKYAAPLKGIVTSGFGYRTHPITGGYSFHYGVDIGASKGAKISSFAEGTVIETGKGSVYGNYVKVEHEGGYWTRYCHLSKISVKKGQKVKISQKIGEAGSTGLSTGVHLHFEVRKGDKILNPSNYVKFS